MDAARGRAPQSRASPHNLLRYPVGRPQIIEYSFPVEKQGAGAAWTSRIAGRSVISHNRIVNF